METYLRDVEATESAGSDFARQLSAGDTVLLEGPLGAGKTTFVRGVLRGLGHEGPVRSPTFQLLSVYELAPLTIHADLYRVTDVIGSGLEEHLGDALCLVEWPDRLGSLLYSGRKVKVTLTVCGEGRLLRVEP